MKKYQEYTKNDQGFYFSLVGLMHGTSIVAAFRISEVPKIVSSNPQQHRMSVHGSSSQTRHLDAAS
jgi:hypothetical protein